MDESEQNKYTCSHENWSVVCQWCNDCGITAEEIAHGRDKPPTWEDVDNAYIDGRNLGVVIGALDYKKRRRKKLIEVGYYLCLRRLGESITKGTK